MIQPTRLAPTTKRHVSYAESLRLQISFRNTSVTVTGGSGNGTRKCDHGSSPIMANMPDWFLVGHTKRLAAVVVFITA